MEVDGERKPERKSFLSRLASKRKSRNVSKDEADGAVVAGTATEGAVAAEPTDEVKKSTEIPGATEEGTHEAEVVGAPLSPVHTRNSAAPKTKPDLERHITNVETSSESESDGEESRERKREKKDKKRMSALGWLSGGGKSDKEDAADKDVEKIPSQSTAGEHSTDAPAVAPATASTTATKSIVDVEPPRESTASSRPDVEKEKEKDSKRIRGFFSKLRTRQSSKAERKPGSFSAATPRGEESTTKDDVVAEKKEEQTPTTAPAALPTASDPRPTSPSSFNRHNPDSRKSSTDLEGDVSSLSSSGLDEDDLKAGRTGRMARALGLKKGKGKEAEKTEDEKAGKGVKSDDDGDSDQFEEARDTFDEGLAPRPSFAGQAKSASPARETRFHEEV